VELCPNDAAITGKGNRRNWIREEAFAATAWQMLELVIRLKLKVKMYVWT
jgi:hypothetical protein